MPRPSVLFVCVKNGGTSQMAAGLLRATAGADLVITLGRDAHVDPVDGTRFESWHTDEPSERGIDGIERMRLVRDDIARRVDALTAQLLRTHDVDQPPPTPRSGSAGS